MGSGEEDGRLAVEELAVRGPAVGVVTPATASSSEAEGEGEAVAGASAPLRPSELFEGGLNVTSPGIAGSGSAEADDASRAVPARKTPDEINDREGASLVMIDPSSLRRIEAQKFPPVASISSRICFFDNFARSCTSFSQ